MLNEFRTSNTKTISMIPEQTEVRISGDTAIMIIQLQSREQIPAIQTTPKPTANSLLPLPPFACRKTIMHCAAEGVHQDMDGGEDSNLAKGNSHGASAVFLSY